MGGLGLTTGLLDAAHLGKALRQILLEQVNTDILTKYAETRRRIFIERTNPVSHANLLRLCSEQPADIVERKETFAKLNNPKDFVNVVRIGLPDFSLTSTSDKIFDTYGEVTWFISVTRIPEWIEEKFQYEYKTIHANMVRDSVKHVPVIRGYVQLKNSEKTVEGTERPSWDYVTCLTWSSLFVLHAGFQDPDYRATAGAHIFCRLDQQGCIASQVAKYSKARVDDKTDIGSVQSIVYHKRFNASDDYSESWFIERAARMKELAASDDQVHTYILWRDVTPKNTDYFFNDTQFSGGSWLKYKAVETLAFINEGAADSFFEHYHNELLGQSVGSTQTVIGTPDLIV